MVSKRLDDSCIDGLRQAAHGFLSMNRIESAFERAKSEGRSAFVAYVCAGDPNPEISRKACGALLDSGIDILELGVPFSDPLADGLTNQLAAQRALEAGVTQEDVFKLVESIREENDTVPIVFYTYYNLMFSNGLDAYVKRAKAAGVDGMLVLDLPPEEAEEHMEVCERHGMKTVFLLAPTTPKERAGYIAKYATGFVYYVSRTGVTGVRDDVASDLEEMLAMIRETTDKPVVVGFGIAKREQAEATAKLADGIVVGSAIVNTIAENLDDAEKLVFDMKALVTDLVGGTKVGA